MTFLDSKDLEALALRLAKDGPAKTFKTPRRVRILYRGACLADTLGTTGALFVWEHPYYPQLYFPAKAFKEAHGYQVTITKVGEITNEQDRKVATRWTISIRPTGASSDESASIVDSIIKFADDLEGPASDLKGMVKVEFGAVDQWLEEDTPIFVHPKDPFKRIDILVSTRPVKVAIDGRTVAETNASMHLYETGLPVRFYMPLTAIDPSILRPSKTRTQCPYKGEAEYYNVVIDKKEYKDIIWFYNRPTVECASITGMCCFYDEKVDVQIKGDGEWEALERPQTHWS